MCIVEINAIVFMPLNWGYKNNCFYTLVVGNARKLEVFINLKNKNMYLFFDTETTGLPRNWKAL